MTPPLVLGHRGQHTLELAGAGLEPSQASSPRVTLLGIAAGFVVIYGLIPSQRFDGMTWDDTTEASPEPEPCEEP